MNENKILELASALDSTVEKVNLLLGTMMVKEGLNGTPAEAAACYVEGINLVKTCAEALRWQNKQNKEQEEELDNIKKQNEEILHNLSCLQDQIGDLKKSNNRSKQATE